MPSWQGKSRGNRLGYSIFISLLRHGGLGPAYFLLRFVSFYFFLFSWSSSRIILAYFCRLGYRFPASLFRLYRNYYLLGQTIIDRIVIFSGLPNRFRYQFDGEEYLREMVRSGRGGLLLSAHLGNWEIAGHLLRRLDVPVYIVIFDGEEKELKEYLNANTGERWAKIIVLKNDLSHIYEIHTALSQNALICMHADRFLDGNRTMRATLMGEEANFPLGPFALARSMGVPVSFVFAMKESNRDYHFFASPPILPDRLDKSGGMEKMLTAYASSLEEKIRQYPEQWYNYFDFWNT